MKTRRLIVGLAILCISGTPVMADLSVDIDIHGTLLTLTDIGGGQYSGLGEEGPGSTLDAYIVQDGFTILQQTQINPLAVDDLVFNLTFTGAGESWMAIGDLSLKDTSGNVVLKGDIVGAGIDYVDGTDNSLEIRGVMVTPAGDDSILQTSGAWTFAGDSTSIGLAQGAENYDNGTLVVVHYLLPSSVTSLSSLFGYVTANGATTLQAGNVDITVVPVPAAVLLGMLGLSAAGLKLRRRSA